MQAHIRFKTPNISLATLADVTAKMSPLSNIVSLIEELRAAPKAPKAREQLSVELRMFGCVARAKVRDHASAIRKRLEVINGTDAEANSVATDDVDQLCTRLLDDIDLLFEHWRALRPDFLDSDLPRASRETYEWVDEYLSLVVEEKLTDLLRRLDKRTHTSPESTAIRNRTRDRLVKEQGHREGAGYASIVHDDSNNEDYVYRQSKLKKFVQSVLWLEISKEKEGRRRKDVGAGIAAGAAMFLAVVLTILSTQFWMMNTWGFVIAATITYILKDRIKDWLKGYFNRRMSRWLADFSVKIRDPITGNDLGRCREAFVYLSMDDVPEDVMACRRRGSDYLIDSEAKPDVIMKYEKQINLKPTTLIKRLHVDYYDINDIIRFSVSEFLWRADDPITVLPVYDPETDSVEKREFHKVYHMNVIMVFHAKSVTDKPVMKRVRVVFDKKEICRLEEVV